MQLGYRAGCEKIWYSKRSQQTVCREYLLCLITSDDLFTRGAECVPHQAKKSFYAALLKDPASAKAPLAPAPLFDGTLVADPVVAQTAAGRAKRRRLRQVSQRLLGRGRGAKRGREDPSHEPPPLPPSHPTGLPARHSSPR